MFADHEGGKFINEYEGIENARLFPPTTFDEAVEKAAAEVVALGRALAEKLTPIINDIADKLRCFAKILPSVVEVALAAYPNKRVVHLAKHGHGRTKKKNIHRILKWYQRGAL